MNTNDLEKRLLKKYGPVPGISIAAVQKIARQGLKRGFVGLETVMRVQGCKAIEADAVLRDMAVAGFVTLDTMRKGDRVTWELTVRGRALAMDARRKEITREKAAEILGAVRARACEINRDPDRLHRVRLFQFGSTLQERESYGDVDIAIKLLPRDLPKDQELRIKALLEGRAPESASYSFIGRLFLAAQQDRREIKSILTAGFAALSLTDEDLNDLGASYRVLVDHDTGTDEPVEASGSIVLTNERRVEDYPQVPPVTAVEALRRVRVDHVKVERRLWWQVLSDPEGVEARAFTPVFDGTKIVPADERKNPELGLAGFQHLCDVWKRDIDGVSMMKLAAEWADENTTGWVRKITLYVECSRSRHSFGYHGSAIVRIGLGSIGFGDNCIVVVLGSGGETIKEIMVRDCSLSRLDLAAIYALSRAGQKIYQEFGIEKLRPPKTTDVSAGAYIPFMDAPVDLSKISRGYKDKSGAIDWEAVREATKVHVQLDGK